MQRLRVGTRYRPHERLGASRNLSASLAQHVSDGIEQTAATKDHVDMVVTREVQPLRVEMAEQIQGLRAEIHGEIQGLRTDVHDEIQGLRAAVHREIQSLHTLKSLHTEMHGEVQDLHAGMWSESSCGG